MRYKFVQINEVDGSMLTMEFDAIILPEMLERFEAFLAGCTFVLPGTLGFLEEDCTE
jgi:hypothetical protein